MMNCKEATALLSRALDEPLTRRERVSLTLHTAMCSACRQTGQQFAQIRGWIRQPEEEKKKDDPSL